MLGHETVWLVLAAGSQGSDAVFFTRWVQGKVQRDGFSLAFLPSMGGQMLDRGPGSVAASAEHAGIFQQEQTSNSNLPARGIQTQAP